MAVRAEVSRDMGMTVLRVHRRTVRGGTTRHLVDVEATPRLLAEALVTMDPREQVNFLLELGFFDTETDGYWRALGLNLGRRLAGSRGARRAAAVLAELVEGIGAAGGTAS